MKYNYNTKENFDYYDGNRLDIIDEIPKNKIAYLDVGCGRGRSFNYLKIIEPILRGKYKNQIKKLKYFNSNNSLYNL